MANEPRAYREVLAGTLAELRPCLLVHLLEPAELDETTRWLRPALVICSQLSAVVRAHAGAWLRLPVWGAEPAEIGTGESGREFLASDLATVLDASTAVIDRPEGANHPNLKRCHPEHRPAADHHAP